MPFWRTQAAPSTFRQRLSSYFPARSRPLAPQPAGWTRNKLVQRVVQLIGLSTLASDGAPTAADSTAVRVTSLSVQLLAMRKTASDIGDLKPFWPLLLPLLAWVGYRAFWDERARIRQRR